MVARCTEACSLALEVGSPKFKRGVKKFKLFHIGVILELANHVLEPRSTGRINSIWPITGRDLTFLIILCFVRLCGAHFRSVKRRDLRRSMENRWGMREFPKYIETIKRLLQNLRLFSIKENETLVSNKIMSSGQALSQKSPGQVSSSFWTSVSYPNNEEFIWVHSVSLFRSAVLWSQYFWHKARSTNSLLSSA